MSDNTEALRRLIADDAYAMSFQSMGQYRTALLAALAQQAAPPTDNTLGAMLEAAMVHVAAADLAQTTALHRFAAAGGEAGAAGTCVRRPRHCILYE